MLPETNFEVLHCSALKNDKAQINFKKPIILKPIVNVKFIAPRI